MANDAEWQKRRTDEWVLMLDQSRLRKEKRLAEKQSTSESHVEEKIETHVRKLIDTS